MISITELIRKEINLSCTEVYGFSDVSYDIGVPDNKNFGDYSVNVAMKLASRVKKTPLETAQDIVNDIYKRELQFDFDGTKYSIFSTIEIVRPGFINFRLSNRFLLLNLFEIKQRANLYGSSNLGAGKNTVVEYSEPNPNKPMHIGHVRNNFIGSSLAAILKFLGYNVVKVNYINDWGTHICKSMLMYKKFGNNALPDIKPDHFVGKFYAMYEAEAENHPELAEELAQMFQKLEKMDPETLELWKKITDWVYDGWKQTYLDQGVSFDDWFYQHNYKDSGKEVVKIAEEKGIASKDETGAVIAHLEQYGIPDKVLLRSDGTSIYSTQDLQLALDNFEKYNFDKRLYVVDMRQSDYFKQIFKILQLLGFDWASRLFHVAYGMVTLPEGQMSSRKGLVVNADDVFAKLVELEGAEITKSIKRPSSIDDTVRKVAQAAFRYGMLRVDPKQDITFSYEQVTKFEGSTGPYLLYTFARCFSVLEKGGKEIKTAKFDNEWLTSDLEIGHKEQSLIRKLVHFSEVVQKSADQLAPHHVANYALELAQEFNSFYGDTPILDAESSGIRSFRLLVTDCSAQVLKNTLALLGIDVVEKM